MKEVYWEIKINNLSGPRQAKFWQKSGPRFVYFDLPIYFLHGIYRLSMAIVRKPGVKTSDKFSFLFRTDTILLILLLYNDDR